jgi:hypothetical protein
VTVYLPNMFRGANTVDVVTHHRTWLAAETVSFRSQGLILNIPSSRQSWSPWCGQRAFSRIVSAIIYANIYSLVLVPLFRPPSQYRHFYPFLSRYHFRLQQLRVDDIDANICPRHSLDVPPNLLVATHLRRSTESGSPEGTSRRADRVCEHFSRL